MHNNIMVAGLRDRPPMLAIGRYPQWRLRFLRYIDTKPDGEALRKCILSGPYKLTTVLVQAVAAIDDSSAIPEHTTIETPMNMSPANKAHFKAEKEAIHLILTEIGDKIYSTVDACQTAQEMWEAIERLQQGESLNTQHVKTNLFWEFGKFTSHDGETMESYYTRFYKLMNEMIRNNLIVATMQVNVQFLQQLQPEWSRFVTIVKQQHKLDEVSSHKLFDILKQYQKEVNELHAERLARNANPLALVATAQANQDPYYQTSKSHKSYAPSSKPSIPTRSHKTTRYKGKEIAKHITPPFVTISEEDSDPEQAQRDKDMQKNLALIAKYFKKIYKPTNNNLRTSSNSRNKNECKKPKRVKDSAYHKEKMLLCKQVEQGVPLQAEQYDWLADMDEEIDEQELEAHYSYMEKIQEVPTADSGTNSEQLEQVQNDAGYNVFANDLQHSEQSESISNTCLGETDDSNVIPDSPDMCNDDIQNNQNDVESDDKRVALANLIANLKLDVDENKKIQKQLKKANTTLAQELKECKTILAKTSNALRGFISVRDSFLVALQTKQTEFKKYKAFNDRTVDYDKLKQIVDNAWIKHLKDQFRASTAQDMEILIQTCLMPLAIKTHNDSFLFVHELKQELHADLKYVESLEKEIVKLESDKAKFSNMYDMIFEFKKLIEKYNEKSVDTKFDKPFVARQPNAQRIPKPSVLGVNHKTNISRPQHKSNQLKDKVLPNNSQVKLKKNQVEVHPRIPSVFNKMKSVTACKDSLNSRTLNANVVCATCNKCLVDSNHFACVTKMLNDVNARAKKPNLVPISTRKPKCHTDKSVTTPHKNKVASKSTNQKPQSYYRMLYENTSKTWKWWIEQQTHQDINEFQRQKCNGYLKLRMKKYRIEVYYFKGLNHNLFSVGQFCDADLEVAFKKSTCFVRDLQGNNLLTGNRGSDLYTISLRKLTSSTPLYLMAKASPTQAWLWHRILSHLNFNYINLLSKKDVVIGLSKLKYVKDQLYSSCESTKAKRSSFKSKVIPTSKGRLHLLDMDLCGPMRVASINGKKYILVIVDDYSRYNWTLFLRSKDETPELLKEFLTMIQRNLQASVITVRTDRGTEFLNKTLNALFKEEGIKHQTSTSRTPKQNGVVERQNCTLVEAARMMLSALKLPLLFWFEAIATSFYNKRTRMIVESIHIRFDEIKEVYETSVANDTSGLVPRRQKASDYDNSDPVRKLQDVSSSADENNYDQAKEDHVPDDEFTNPFYAPAHEVAESSSHNIGNSNVPTFNQPQVSEYRWTKDHLLGQVRGNPSRPVQTRRQLATDPKMYMFALTVSTTESKNIKETMADSAWIETMQEELHQFDRLQEEVYVAQPDGFVDPDHPEKVYHLRKALYGLQQAPRACRFEMSLMGEMKFFLGLQIHQSPHGIFINQAKYALEILHKYGMEKGQSIGTPMAIKPKLDADLSGNPVDQTDYHSKIRSLMYLTSSRPNIVQAGSSFDLTAFSDVDHAGCIDSRKSTSREIQFVGDKLVSWMSKKQNCTTMSSAEAEYVALSSRCAQVMWMRTQLQDYGFHYNKIPLYCDSQSAIAISCNPVKHSRTKHIHTRYHFIKEQVENGIIELYFVRTEYQLDDIFTKALYEDRFKYLIRRIGMRCMTPTELEVLANKSA
nr:retrovirus-related Pol polyprotein from transposon TNT 1-94 [Tanacetum cinerariifolium]